MSCHNRESKTSVTYASPGMPITLGEVECVSSYSATANAVYVLGATNSAKSQVQELEERVSALEATIQRYKQYYSQVETSWKEQLAKSGNVNVTEHNFTEAEHPHQSISAYDRAMELVNG